MTVLLRVLLLSGLLLSLLLAVGQAQVKSAITSDGTLGTAVSPRGAVFNITGGTRHGPNLFHSFDRFSVGKGDTASFTSEQTGIKNILSRVTGGQQSVIDGTLQSTIPGANLYLLNPSGVLFGPNAMLNVSGSFHVSTADYLLLAGGARFSAHLSETSTFSMEPPAAFGFLGAQPAPISTQGSILRVPEGKTLSVVGGDIQIVGGQLVAPGGRIQLASVASAGEVIPSAPGQAPDLEVASFTGMGQITISQKAFIDASGSNTSTGSGGTVLLRGGRLMLLDSSSIMAITTGAADGARLGIDLRLTGEAVLSNDGTMHTGTVVGTGRGGDLVAEVGRLSLTGGAQISSSAASRAQGGSVRVTARDSVTLSGQSSSQPSGIFSRAQASSSAPQATGAGDIALEVGGTLTLQDGAQIQSGSQMSEGGNVTVTARGAVAISNGSGISSLAFFRAAGQVLVSAPRVTMDNGFISTSNLTASGAGNIALTVDTLSLTGGAQIASSSTGLSQSAGRGGRVTVTANDTVFIAGRSSASPSNKDPSSGLFSTTLGPGDAGAITVSAPSVTLSDGGKISVATTGRGSAGNIAVDAGNLTLTGGAVIDSSTDGVGRGGAVTVVATEMLAIAGRDSAGNPSGLFSNTLGREPGGTLALQARQIDLSNGGTISARSSGAGDAGDIRIQAGQTFRSAQSTVTTEATQAGGGNITIEAGVVSLTQDSRITAAAMGADVGSNGGNVTIRSEAIALNHSQVQASAVRGHGGTITIGAPEGVLLTDAGTCPAPARSCLNASSEVRELSGTVEVRAPVTSISGIIAPLPQSFARAAELLHNRCATRLREGTVSRFVLGGRDGVPLEPGALLLSPLPQGSQEHTAHHGHGEAMRPGHGGAPGLDPRSQAQGQGGFAQAFVPRALEVECVRWVETPGTPARGRR